MIVFADVKWDNDTTLTNMATSLAHYNFNTAQNLVAIFGVSSQQSIQNTQISIRCGEAPTRSGFVFMKGTGQTSLIAGHCSTNRFDHLLDDFDYLQNQMEASGLKFNLNNIRVSLNNEKLVKKNARVFLLKRSVWVDFIAMTGLIPIATGLLFLETFSDVAFVAFIVGLIFWFVTLLIGYGAEPKYVLKK